MIRVDGSPLSLYSRPPPPNTADLGTDEKAAVFGNRRVDKFTYSPPGE